MNGLLFLSLTANFVLVVMLCFRKFKKKSETQSEVAPQVQKPEVVEQKEPRVVNEWLHNLAAKCEAKLPPECRNKVKLLVEVEYPELPAILQIGDVKISLKRLGALKSLFEISSVREALTFARDGYGGTGRYIPVPSEVEFVLAHREIINVYLEAIGLDLISAEDEFWTVETGTGWVTGWKRFNWDIDIAFSKLKDNFRVRTSQGLKNSPSQETAKLFLLLKGWEHLFVEV